MNARASQLNHIHLVKINPIPMRAAIFKSRPKEKLHSIALTLAPTKLRH